MNNQVFEGDSSPQNSPHFKIESFNDVMDGARKPVSLHAGLGNANNPINGKSTGSRRRKSVSKKFYTNIDALNAAQSRRREKLALCLAAALLLVLFCLFGNVINIASVTALACNQPALAVKLSGVALTLDPGIYETLVKRATALSTLGQLDQAIACYTAAIQLKPRASETFYRRGLAEQKNKDFTKALADFDKALQLQPQMVPALINRGAVYAHLGNRDKALADYTVAVSLDPANEEAISDLCWLRNRNDDQSFSTMEDLYGLLTDKDASSKTVQLAAIGDRSLPSRAGGPPFGAFASANQIKNQAKEHEGESMKPDKMGKFQHPLQKLDQPVAPPKARAGHQGILGQLAETTGPSGHSNSPIDVNARGLEHVPEAKSKTAADLTMLPKTNLGKADQDLDQPAHPQAPVDAEKPDENDQARKALLTGNPLTRLGKLQGSFTQAVTEKAPVKLDETYRQVETKALNSNSKEAIESINQILEADWTKPYRVHLNCLLGRLYAKNGDFQAAVDAYTRAIDLSKAGGHPCNPHIIGERGCDYVGLGKFDLGLADLNTSIEQLPDNRRYLRWRMRAYSGLGMKTEAQKDRGRLQELQKPIDHSSTN